MPARHILLALLVTVIWGLNFVVIKVGVGTVPPLLLSALRFAFAAVPAIFFLPRPAADWRIVTGYGFILGVVKFGLLFTAIAVGMPAGLASLVLQAQAFFTILFAALVLKEKPGPHQFLGGVVACLGLVLIGWPRLTGSEMVPFLLTVAAAAAWGVANIVSKRAGRIDMLGFIVWASLVPPIPLLVLSFWIEGWDRMSTALSHLDMTGIGAVAYLAYPTTVIGFGIWGFLMSRHTAATVAPFSLLVPMTGIACASLILGERMLPIEALGGAVIILGLVINTFGLRLIQRLRPASAM